MTLNISGTYSAPHRYGSPGAAADGGVTQGRSPRPRTELDLAAQQLRAIERFNRGRHAAEEAAATTARSREMRMDAARRVEVLRREHEALVARAHEQLRSSGNLIHETSERRVVLAHRNAWFARKVADTLQDLGIVVVAQFDNGADVVGLAVAEQPDLVLVEETLTMVPGDQVVREVREFCPETIVVAQVTHGARVGALLDAGAAAVWTRSVPPRDVAVAMHGLIS